MKRLLAFVIIAAGVPWAQDAAAQRDFSKVEIKTTHVSENVYMLEGRGGNIGVSVGADGILIVDDQFAPLAEKIRAALKKLGEGKLKFVLNTHFHGDHVGGNPEFGREASIIAHANVRKRLRAGDSPMVKEGLPVITFDDALSVHFNGEEIRAIHFPSGHTDTDSVIFFTQSNVVHMGDHFFNGRFPFVDLKRGGDVAGYTKNVGEVLKELPPDAKIIPGHGALATLDDLKAFHAMLAETTEFVKKRLDEGKSLEQIRNEGLPDKWDGWGEGFISEDRWIAAIAQSFGQ